MFPYLISIPILSEITRTKEKQLRKMYAQIIDNDCVPLPAIPFDQQEKYAKDYLLRSQYVDIDLMQEATPDSDTPYLSEGVQRFFQRTNVVRKALSIQAAYAADRTVTAKLTELASSSMFSNNDNEKPSGADRQLHKHPCQRRYLHGSEAVD